MNNHLFMIKIEYLTFLLISCLSVLSCYCLLHIFFRQSPEYNSLSYNKKCYVLKNVTKSIILFIMTFYSIDKIIIPALEGSWNNKDVHTFSSAYVSNDIIGLLIVPKLPFSTKMHHIITGTLLFYSYTIDFTENNVGRWMFIYTLMSTITFLVNTYLGLRHIRTESESNLNRIIDNIRVMAFYIYLVACLINWSIHIYLISQKIYNLEYTIPYIMYSVLLIPIINDDLILMKWLHNNVNK